MLGGTLHGRACWTSKKPCRNQGFKKATIVSSLSRPTDQLRQLDTIPRNVTVGIVWAANHTTSEQARMDPIAGPSVERLFCTGREGRKSPKIGQRRTLIGGMKGPLFKRPNYGEISITFMLRTKHELFSITKRTSMFRSLFAGGRSLESASL